MGTNYFYYFCTMELFKQLASLMLPSQILDYFDVVKVEEGATQIEISLDETYPESYKADENIESKGFMEPTTITDFPIRDHKLLLHVRRRRWLNRKDGVSFCRPLNLVAEGTCYSKEFAAFLKIRMESSPVTCRTLEEFYHINGRSFEKQYKETLVVTGPGISCLMLRSGFSLRIILVRI